MANVQSLLAKLRRPSSSADSDRMLLARFASQGDESAFAAIVARHGPLVLGVCRRTIGDAHLAEDAYQATFLTLAKTAHRVAVKESLAGWLYVVARRIAVKAARRCAADPVREPIDRTDATPREAMAELDEELARLPEKYRAPLIAFHLQDRTQDETAQLLGVPLGTLRRRLDTGRDLLRSRLAARGLSLGVAASVSVPAALAEGAIASAAAIRSGAAVGPHLLPLVNEGLRMGTHYWKLGGLLALAAVTVGVAVSHGEDKPKESKPDPRQLIAAPGATAKWATVTGRVVWPENGPGIPAIVVQTDKEHCLSKGELTPDEVIVNKKNRGLKNVWVYLRPDSDARDATFAEAQIPEALRTPKAREHAVDQPCCQFIPRVLAVRVGDTIAFKNSSPISHNVKYTSNTATPDFNVTMPPGQSHTTPALKADLRPNSFECNIHPWMRGQLMVYDHPFYALTDADGNFEIKSAPAGKFRIVYRHELGYHKGKDGNLGFPIAIAGPKLELDPITFSQPPTK